MNQVAPVRNPASSKSPASASSAEKLIRTLFSQAGINIGGTEPWDIRVHDPRFYGRLMREGSMGLGESYMDMWWETDALDQFLEKVLSANLQKHIRENWKLFTLKALFINLQQGRRAYQVAEVHYDLGNDLYQAMLDKRMVYTCGYWKNATNLAEAQEAKLDLICRKAGLKPGMKVLDLGCGWGGFAAYAAEKYGVEAVGITVSKEQVALGRELWKGLPVEMRLADYKEITGTYDAVVSIGMLEHIGYKNYRTMMKVVDRSLKPGGIAVLHTIGNNTSRIHAHYGFIEKYIFPNGCAPSLAQLAKAAEGLFVVEDVQNIGPDYDPTLMAWWDNFKAAWPQLKGPKYDDRFYKMWEFYLLGAAAASRVRQGQLYHLILTKPGRKQPPFRG